LISGLIYVLSEYLVSVAILFVLALALFSATASFLILQEGAKRLETGSRRLAARTLHQVGGRLERVAHLRLDPDPSVVRHDGRGA